MNRRHTVLLAAILVLAVTAAVFASGRRGNTLKAGEYEIDGRIYGMAAAEVFEDPYSGPSVVGDSL